MLVTLSYLAKIFLNVRDLDKNSVLSPILTFGTTPIFLYERRPPVCISLFRRSYAYTLHILVTPKSLAQKLLKFLRLCQILAIFHYTQCKNA